MIIINLTCCEKWFRLQRNCAKKDRLLWCLTFFKIIDLVVFLNHLGKVSRKCMKKKRKRAQRVEKEKREKNTLVSKSQKILKSISRGSNLITAAYQTMSS